MKLSEKEAPPFFQFYADYVSEENIAKALEDQLDSYLKMVREIPEDKYLYRYKENKWTIKEVIGHNTDTERIKCTAALRIARNDETPIPGFDEDQYVANVDFNSRSMESLLEEFIAVRKSSIALFKSFSEDDLKKLGTASAKLVSVRALGYFLVGHVSHHVKILKERYLV